MKLTKHDVKKLEQPAGLEGIYKQIELAGRTCYKSEDKITEDSAKGFVDRMIASKHTAMLEHGTVYLKMLGEGFRYMRDPFSRVRLVSTSEEPESTEEYTFYITTNLRILVENGWLDDLEYICEPTEHHVKRHTFKITTDRGVSHELVRHRVFSFAQESTRYCNYNKDKYSNQITFIIPTWLEDQLVEGEYKYNDTLWEVNGFAIFDADVHNDRNLFLWGIKNDEDYYNKLITEFNWKPQEARQILSNALKTEMIMTGFEDDWDKFLDLRYKESTGKVHPDMKNISTKIYKTLYEFTNS